MNNAEVEAQSFYSASQGKHPVLPWLLQEKGLVSEKTQLVQELSQEFTIHELKLGDALINLPDSSANSAQNSDYFYLICRGKIRILSSSDNGKKRSVPTQLLTEGQTLGGDALFCETCLSYQAIAASPVQVAKISVAKLQLWLQKLPKLHQEWQKVAQHRQSLIFFKTLTRLRSLASHRLEQLSQYIVAKKVVKGESLTQVTPAEAGHFWLRSGKIQNQPAKLVFSWGYPGKTPIDWVAQTDLLIYHLPREHWQTAIAIAPILTTAFSNNSPSNPESNSSSNGHRKHQVKVNLPINKTSPKPVYQNAIPTPVETNITVKQEPTSIDFPKPFKHRAQPWQAYPFIAQQSSADCGAACLAMISQYWGKRFSLNHLRNLAGVGRSGASLKNLAKAGESLGYQARPVRASLNRLVEQKNPWIAHWQGDHYIVVYWVKGNQVLVSDPAMGKYKLSRQVFLAGWTGYALLLEPTERLYETPGEKRSLGRFLKLLLPYRTLGLQIILASVLIQIFGLISPLFTQIILDQVVVNRSQSTLNVFVIGSLLFGIGGMGLSSVRTYLLNYLSNRLDLTMISGFINHALTLPLKFLNQGE